MSKKDKYKDMPWTDRYKFLKHLGGGGNGTVLLCKDANNEQVALKQLSSEALRSSEALSNEKKERFLREQRVLREDLAGMEGIIPILDYSEKDFWYTMPVAKPAMDTIDNGNFDIYYIVANITNLALVLGVVHSRHIAHRDIKPGNILVYNDRFCFCDFGLCRIESSELTRKDENMGAKFTIDPQMKRHPKTADPYKADVYSLAKTLWMFLTGDKQGFEGQYNALGKGIGLHHFELLKDIPLADIEELLFEATANDPDVRPDCNQFAQKLVDWMRAFDDPALAEKREWEMLKRYLNPTCDFDSMTFTNRNEIIRVLNRVRLMPASNHMFYPGGGGLDFEQAEAAAEEGCIALYTGWRTWDIIKPKRLIFESMGDNGWTYLLLELEPLKPILTSADVMDEVLVEDTPGHYCDATDAVYKVYDYDCGNPLPAGWRQVNRFCRGNFIIVPKFGYYNKIGATYDGRHARCTPEEFKAYVAKLKDIQVDLTQKEADEAVVKHALNSYPNPFPRPEIAMEPQLLVAPKGFGEDAVRKLLLRDEINQLKDKSSPSDFVLKVKTIGNTSVRAFLKPEEPSDGVWYLCKDGSFHEVGYRDDAVVRVKSREAAEWLNNAVNQAICAYFEASGYDCEEDVPQCHLVLTRAGSPSHLFTIEEIKAKMVAADDRKGNSLVIDEYGYARVIPGYPDKNTYPVSQETWGSRNNYCGPYSSLSDLMPSYRWMLQGWLRYLQTGVPVYMDYDASPLTEEELVAEILKFYSPEGD